MLEHINSLVKLKEAEDVLGGIHTHEVQTIARNLAGVRRWVVSRDSTAILIAFFQQGRDAEDLDASIPLCAPPV